MKVQMTLVAALLAFAACSNVEKAEASDVQAAIADDGCTLTSSAYRGYYYGFNSCKTGNDLKSALQQKIKGHRVIKYTEDAATVPTGYDFTGISDNLRYLDNYADPVPTRFDVWDYFIGLALKGAKPAAITCPTTSPNRVYEYYSGYCYIPAGSVTTVTNIPRLFDSSSIQQQGSMNREHSWPKSWFLGAAQANDPATGNYCYNGNSDASYANFYDYRALTDIHHLLPTNSVANSTRSNNAFGIVDVAGTTYTGVGADAATPATGGKSGTPHHTNITQGLYAACGAAADQVPCSATTVFEPPDHVKGDIARVYFYMATRYYTEDSCWLTSDAVNKANIKTWQENMLRKWHTDDPVDAGERTKNDLIHRIQGNRNPFIDHPEWVAKITDF